MFSPLQLQHFQPKLFMSNFGILKKFNFTHCADLTSHSHPWKVSASNVVFEGHQHCLVLASHDTSLQIAEAQTAGS